MYVCKYSPVSTLKFPCNMIRGMPVHSLAQKMKTLISPQNRKQFTQSMYWTNYSKHTVQPEKPIFQEEFSLYFLYNNYIFFSVFKVIKSLIETFSPKRTYFELKTIPGRHREREVYNTFSEIHGARWILQFSFSDFRKKYRVLYTIC